MITIIMLDPPIDRAVVDAVQFPSRAIDAHQIDAPAQALVCHHDSETLSRVEQWLGANGYRATLTRTDVPTGMVWQRWERRA